MKQTMKIGALALSTLAATAIVVQSCGGSDGTEPSGSATAIDLTVVTKGIAEVSTIIPVCRVGAGLREMPNPAATPTRTAWLERALQLRQTRSHGPALTLQSLGSTKPADQFGDCGGRITYPVYSHSNGVTTGTYQFDNYCSSDTDTGEKETTNGSISFVNTGTPSASGPITTRVEASSTGGVTMIVRSSTGTQLSSQKVVFTDYLNTIGVPGGNPTSASPNRVSLGDATITDQVTGKSYRETNYSVTQFVTPAGGDQISISGRGYRSNGEYFTVSTTTPITSNSSGATVGGALTFTGSNNTTAVLTLVPGNTLQATMTVNGTPVTSVPVCK